MIDFNIEITYHFTVEFSAKEIENIVIAFKEMNFKPDLDAPQSFIDWMSDYYDSVLPM
jgi:hypothetical protein